MFMSSWTGATREFIPRGYALEGGKGSTFMVGPFLQSAGPPMKILWRVRNFLHRRAISLAGSPAHHPPSIRAGLPTPSATVIKLGPRHSRATCWSSSDRETPTPAVHVPISGCDHLQRSERTTTNSKTYMPKIVAAMTDLIRPLVEDRLPDWIDPRFFASKRIAARSDKEQDDPARQRERGEHQRELSTDEPTHRTDPYA